MWRLSWRKSRGCLFFLGNLRAGSGCRPSSPGRRGQFFRHKVHLPRRVIFPGKTLSTFGKTILTLEKTVSTLENSVSIFVFSPTEGGGRTAGGKNGILLFPNRLNPFHWCMEGLCGPCRSGLDRMYDGCRAGRGRTLSFRDIIHVNPLFYPFSALSDIYNFTDEKHVIPILTENSL